jgi:diguanylate cyclase (GGDEF)-like protein
MQVTLSADNSGEGIGRNRRPLEPMLSFKVKLVSYFVLLTLVPLGAALWGFDVLSQRSETRRADARLQAGLRAGLNEYEDAVAALDRSGTRLASFPAFQRALRDRDPRALRDYLDANPSLQVRAGSLVLGTSPPPGAVVRSVTVVARGRVLGEIVNWFRIDRVFLQGIAAKAGAEPRETFVLLRGGVVRLGPPRLLREPIAAPAGRPSVQRVGRVRYRLLASPPLEQPRGAAFAMLTPEAAIDTAARRSERTMVLALLASLLLVGLVAYGLSRSIVGTLSRLARAAEGIAAGRLGERVPVRGRDEFGQLGRAFNEMAAQLEERVAELEAERTRVSRATHRIGEALGATHDVEQLLTVIVETAVEATGARAGFVRAEDGRERARHGDAASGDELLELPLRASRRAFGTLVLAGHEFGIEERETAASLVAQAVIALENARLHRIVERQALVDGLTGLANRRSAEDTLRTELARAERRGEEVALVLVDIDNFKDVNDRFGHPAGDAVLREFARRLRHTVREIDLAARWGGEEFCLVLPTSDGEGGAQVAERARQALESRAIVLPDGTEVRATASFGVASFPLHAGAGGLVAAADEALYAAKRTGKNRVVTAVELAVAPEPARPGR